MRAGERQSRFPVTVLISRPDSRSRHAPVLACAEARKEGPTLERLQTLGVCAGSRRRRSLVRRAPLIVKTVECAADGIAMRRVSGGCMQIDTLPRAVPPTESNWDSTHHATPAIVNRNRCIHHANPDAPLRAYSTAQRATSCEKRSSTSPHTVRPRPHFSANARSTALQDIRLTTLDRDPDDLRRR